MRRPNGSGSIYYVERSGLWHAAITVGTKPRRRKVVSARTREALEARLEQLGMRVETEAPPSRQTSMQAARALGKHTDAEWYALCRRSPKTCPYCGVPLCALNHAKDHKIPVSRGGSDSVDNLERICWECNLSKGSKTPEEYTYTGEWPRPFRPHPFREKDYLAIQARQRNGIAVPTR